VAASQWLLLGGTERFAMRLTTDLGCFLNVCVVISTSWQAGIHIVDPD
jgi:hypothetical protein